MAKQQVISLVLLLLSSCRGQGDAVPYGASVPGALAAPMLMGTVSELHSCPLPSALLEKALSSVSPPMEGDEGPQETFDDRYLRVHQLNLTFRDARAPIEGNGDLVFLATVQKVERPSKFEALAQYDAIGVSGAEILAATPERADQPVWIGRSTPNGEELSVSFDEVADDLRACDARITYFYPSFVHKSVLKVQDGDQVCSVFPFDTSVGPTEDQVRDCVHESAFFANLDDGTPTSTND